MWVSGSKDGLNFLGSGDKIRYKSCMNPIKTAVNRIILRAKDLPYVKITPYVTDYYLLFAPVCTSKRLKVQAIRK